MLTDSDIGAEVFPEVRFRADGAGLGCGGLGKVDLDPARAHLLVRFGPVSPLLFSSLCDAPEARVCACAEGEDLSLRLLLLVVRPHLQELVDEAVYGPRAGVRSDVDEWRSALERSALARREKVGSEFVVEVPERAGAAP